MHFYLYEYSIRIFYFHKKEKILYIFPLILTYFHGYVYWCVLEYKVLKLKKISFVEKHLYGLVISLI